MRVERLPLSLGLIGCGRLAELGYAPAAAGLADVELIAVADPEPRRRERIARLVARRAAPPRVHGSAAELLAEGRVDAVVLASPPGEHVRQAELASRAGIPCLVEKPPALGHAGAERIAALDPPPWIGFNRRFQHGARLLGSIPAHGWLELELELRYRRAAWRAVAVDDDAVLDLGPHLVDLALMLSGSAAVRVRSAALAPRRAVIELEWERGRARIACATDRPHSERVVARDERGRVLARSVAGGPHAALAGRLPGRVHPLVASLREQVAAFAAALAGGDPGVLATAADGARVMRLIDEARMLGARAA